MSKKLLAILTIICFLLVTFFLLKDLGTHPVERWDEQTNIDVIKQSISDNSFYLTYNQQPFFEKPPLWYYLSIVPVTFWGDSIASYRVISVISALLIILLTYLLVSKRSGPLMGLLSILAYLFIPQLYLTNPAGYFATHTFNSADLDVLQIFFIVLSIFLLFYGQKPRPYQILLSYFSLALGYLTKGPFVIVLLILNTAYLMRLGMKFRRIIIYFMAFLIPVLMWHILMQISFGSAFSLAYLNYHILQRSITPLEGHIEPLWFYMQLFFDPRINLLALPVLIMAMKLRSNNKKDLFKNYLLILIVIILLFFTITATKLAWYILPVYPLAIIFLFI
jgi:4-amino-4-deoxy-L-arabinose transferase-like glycosyltransferase